MINKESVGVLGHCFPFAGDGPAIMMNNDLFVLCRVGTRDDFNIVLRFYSELFLESLTFSYRHTARIARPLIRLSRPISNAVCLISKRYAAQ